MSFPTFYFLNTMTISQWFSMLANEKPNLEAEAEVEAENHDQELNEPTYIYQIIAKESFVFEAKPLEEDDLEEDDLEDKAKDLREAGIYYLRGTPEDVDGLPVGCQTVKLSFSDLVYLSDIFSQSMSSLIPAQEGLNEIVQQGTAFQYFEKSIDSIKPQGLQTMREKVWQRYFAQGLTGTVRRFFSAIANFFRKYRVAVETGIYWPGNSCNYADKVVGQVNRMKRIFIRQAYEASKETVGERLGIPSENLKAMKFEDIKSVYYKKALLVHPDKNPNSDTVAQFQKVSSIWRDFDRLANLKEKFQVDHYQDEDPKIERKPSSKPLNTNRFAILRLPAPQEKS